MTQTPVASEKDAREVLLKTARLLFSQKGLDGTSTRDIAKESGLNISLISYYFGGKEGLYKELFMNFGNHIAQVIDQTMAGFQDLEMNEKNFVESVKRIITMFVNLHEQNKDMANLMWREKLAGMPYSKDAHDQIFLPIGNKVAEFIAQAQRKGIANKKIHPLLYFIVLIEGLMGYLRALECDTHAKEMCPNTTESREKVIDQFTAIFTQGILK